MIELKVDTDRLRAMALDITESLKLQFGDLRSLFREYDTELTKRIKDSFDRESLRPEGGPWQQLAKTTQRAREKRWGSYRYGGRKAGAAHPIGVWTGRMKKRALKKGKSLRREYTRDFGPDDDTRLHLGVFHSGRKDKTQPSRPIYTKKIAEKLLKRTGERWIDAIITAMESTHRLTTLVRLQERMVE